MIFLDSCQVEALKGGLYFFIAYHLWHILIKDEWRLFFKIILIYVFDNNIINWILGELIIEINLDILFTKWSFSILAK